MTTLDKQFIMFKFFLSMEGIYINHEISDNIYRAFSNALSGNINYELADAFFDNILAAIKNSEKLSKSKNELK